MVINPTIYGQSIYVPCQQLVPCSWKWGPTFIICYTLGVDPRKIHIYKHQFAVDGICDVLLGFERIEVGLASGRISVREG
jgi:hypothetical protein